MTDPHNKKSDVIAQQLVQKIVCGEFAPGEKLPQDHFAREFKVSQATVREALMRVVAQGLAISLPRRGMCVAPLDKGAVDELSLMRQALEPLALFHSVPNLTDDQIKHAINVQEQCDMAETALEWEEANRQFHMAIIAGCGMARLTEEINNLQLLYARHFLAKYANRWKSRVDPDHQAIIAAILDRDAPKASAVLQRHLTRLT